MTGFLQQPARRGHDRAIFLRGGFDRVGINPPYRYGIEILRTGNRVIHAVVLGGKFYMDRRSLGVLAIRRVFDAAIASFDGESLACHVARPKTARYRKNALYSSG